MEAEFALAIVSSLIASALVEAGKGLWHLVRKH